MTKTGRWAVIVHDLSLAWIAGGIVGAAAAAILLFEAAPSREVAGQVGNHIFSVFGFLILSLTLVLCTSRYLMRRAAPPGAAPSLWPGITACLIAATLALWLTPAMIAIWDAAPHDPSGAGLTGEDKSRFMRMHGAGNLMYLALFGLSTLMIIQRALGPSSGGPRP